MFIITDAGVKGKGAFTTRLIKKGELIGEYTGELIDEAEADRRYLKAEKTYLFTLEEDKYLDGDTEANILKFVNHSCNPNCEAEIDNLKVLYHAIKDIQEGEEITIDYQLEAEADDPQTCLCGEHNCRGTMKEPAKSDS